MELLSPAGDRTSLIAAVQNGADAVYLGARGFNARRGASNFDGDGLREAVEYCHLRGVKVHVTLNTMVRQDELGELEKAISEIYMSGADAFIIQDLGVAAAARAIAPDMERHASTQLAVHNAQGVIQAAKLGFHRVVLAREMAFDEISRCAGHGVEIEAFAHGALCVSCSGQCLLSSMIGGRSGNRGMCAQPCRMKYTMDGVEGYLLSPRDLMTVDMLDRFRQAGVDSIKIEGRLKRPEYVAVVTRIYRRALDGEPVRDADIEELRQIFNRGGFTHGYAPGVSETELMFRERPNNAGVAVGRVTRGGTVSLDADIDPADALVLRGHGEDVPAKLSGARGETVPCPGAEKGARLIRLTSEAQMERARQSWAGETRPVRLGAKLRLVPGEPAEMEVFSGEHSARATGTEVQMAKSRPLDVQRVETQLRKTGGTVYEFDDIEIVAPENAFMAVSELNALRREALDAMTRELCGFERGPGKLPVASLPGVARRKPLLRAQSGSVSALLKARELGADELVFAPEDMRILDDAPELDAFYLALPQVARAEELEKLNQWALAHAGNIAGVYISNIAHLALNWPGRRIADYPMNIANDLTARELSVEEYSPSVELTARQIAELGGEKDIIVHGYLPLMQLRHCPRRAAHDMPGPHSQCHLCDARNGGLTCLEDRTGARFSLRRMAYDTGCVIQLMNSVPLMLLRRLNRLPDAKAWRLLIDDDTADVTALYRAHLDGHDFTQLPQWHKYKEIKTTTGHYFRGVE